MFYWPAFVSLYFRRSCNVYEHAFPPSCNTCGLKVAESKTYLLHFHSCTGWNESFRRSNSSWASLHFFRVSSSSRKETQSASDFNIFWHYSFIAFRVNRLKWFVRKWSAFPSPQRRCQIKSGISGDGWHEHSDRLHKRRPVYNSWSLLPDAFRRDNKAFGIG